MEKKVSDLNEYLKGPNIYALYEGGEFTTTEEGKLKDNWIMLIDIGRGQHTSMLNGNLPFPAKEFCGQLWEKSQEPYTGEYLVIDDDFMVWKATAVTEEDFNNVRDGIYSGILCMPNRCYYTKSGEFKFIE